MLHAPSHVRHAPISAGANRRGNDAVACPSSASAPARRVGARPEVTAWLAGVTDVVGYGLYLDLLGDLIAGKNRHMSELSEEEARVRRSLQLAAEGRDVALVSSGDAGIYAMAALAFEVLDRDDDGALNRVEIRVSPGISAVAGGGGTDRRAHSAMISP